MHYNILWESEQSKSNVWHKKSSQVSVLGKSFSKTSNKNLERKWELKTENRLSTFVVVGVVYTEIFMSFVKLPF